MKISLLTALVFVLVGCAPKALVTYQNEDQILAKKIKSDGVQPLLFRHSGGTVTVMNLRKLGGLKIVDPSPVVYEGDSWVSVELFYKKDEKRTVHTGWIKSSVVLSANCPGGECSLPFSSLAEIDFLMEESTDTTSVEE